MIKAIASTRERANLSCQFETQKSDGDGWSVEAAERGKFINGKAVFLAKQLQ